MSLSSGPLTEPLARMRGATSAGSMTRMRYVSRVPGACSIATVTKRLVNDDSATRFLECRAAARPAPLPMRNPAAEQAAGEREQDPERERAGANRGTGHHERVRVARGPRQCDAHLELAGARAGAGRAGGEMLRQRRALDQRQLAVELGVDLHQPLLVCRVSHASRLPLGPGSA